MDKKYRVGVIGFGLNYGAYESEIYRAGIASIPVGQWEAAASLGIRRFDLGNRPRSEAGQNIGHHASPDRVHMAGAFPFLPMLQPLCGYALEGVLDRDFLCGLLGLPLCHRVNTSCQ